MLKATFFLFLLCASFSMHIPDDADKNTSIVRVLAAFRGAGIKKGTSGYEYDETTFIQLIEKFIPAYNQQEVRTKTAQQVKMLAAHRNNLQKVGLKVQQMKSASVSRDQERALAAEIIAELDFFYFQVYGFKTDNPDKYIALISEPSLNRTPLDSQSDALRKIFRMIQIKDQPRTYQYFHSRAKRYTSQMDQDGVIQAIFELIGTRNKFFVEVGGGSVIDNTNYLRSAKGWNGLLFNSGLYFVTKTISNMLKNETVYPEKAISIFQKYNVPKQLDFLSVDIDGNDLWVTKALLKQYRPAVVSVEINPNFPVDVMASIGKGHDDFVWKYDRIYGVTARAVYELGKANGYSYVYHMLMTDIFMVRDDLLPEQFRGMSLEDTYDAFPINSLGVNNPALQIITLDDIIPKTAEVPETEQTLVSIAAPTKNLQKAEPATAYKSSKEEVALGHFGAGTTQLSGTNTP